MSVDTTKLRSAIERYWKRQVEASSDEIVHFDDFVTASEVLEVLDELDTNRAKHAKTGCDHTWDMKGDGDVFCCHCGIEQEVFIHDNTIPTQLRPSEWD